MNFLKFWILDHAAKAAIKNGARQNREFASITEKHYPECQGA
jgi:hypothetical protein